MYITPYLNIGQYLIQESLYTPNTIFVAKTCSINPVVCAKYQK